MYAKQYMYISPFSLVAFIITIYRLRSILACPISVLAHVLLTTDFIYIITIVIDFKTSLMMFQVNTLSSTTSAK